MRTGDIADTTAPGELAAHRCEPRDGALTATIVDDHPAIIAAIEHWYSKADPRIDVVASGHDVKAAWTPPGDTADVVVFDLQLASGEAAYADLRRLVDADRQVIVYTMRDDQHTALNCLEIGAFTVLTKAKGAEHIVAATVAAAEDRPYTPPSLAGALGTDARADRPQLSHRERTVLLEWFQSESKELVAEKLGIRTRTINTYLDRVRIKYANVGRSARTKTSMLARAIEDGLIDPNEL